MIFNKYDVDSLSQANEIIVLTLDTISQEIQWSYSQNDNIHYLAGKRSNDSIEHIYFVLENMAITECVINNVEIEDLSLFEHLLCTIMFSNDFYRMDYYDFVKYLKDYDLTINYLNGDIVSAKLNNIEEDEDYEDEEDILEDIEYEALEFGDEESEENDFWGQDEYYESEEDGDEENEVDNINYTARTDSYFDRLNPESILTEYGYSVSKNVDLTPHERHEILKKILKNENISINRIINHLQWCIDKHPQKNQKEARNKWQSDIDYLKTKRHWY